MSPVVVEDRRTCADRDDEVFRLDRARLSECEGQLFDEERKALPDRSQ
jgi:hypothetical protein